MSDAPHEPASDAILIPAPTAWPFVTAFGIALMFTGLVTHLVVSVVGIVVLARGLVGWWRDVLPEERHERVPMPPVGERPAEIPIVRHSVRHLSPGKAGHRVRIPAEIHPYSAGVRGGIVGAAAMAVVAVAYGLIAQGSVWYPINLLSAAAMPSMAEASTEHLRAFDATAFGVAVVSHILISILVGLVYAVMLPMFPGRLAPLWGGIVAPLLWTGLVWASLDVLNPALNARVNWAWFVASQVAFGLTAGYVIARSERIETMQSWPLVARAGLKGPYSDPDEEESER